MQFSFQALGTTWWIEIFNEDIDKGRDEVIDFITAFVNQYEQRYSRFKDDSCISTLNRERKYTNPDPEFVKLLEYGKQLYLRTDTFFNILTGHILEAKGYDKDYSFQNKTFHDNGRLERGNPITDLMISDKLITLTTGNVDLGGYGKGYLIDLLADQLQSTLGIDQFLINGGGDMYATHQAGESIQIHLEHPINHGSFIANTTLKNQGFAASSPHRRVWQNSTGTHHHIISDNITADGTYIKAVSAADADAFATTVLQLDKNKIETLAQDNNLAVAQFDATTSMLTKTRNFEQSL